MSVRSAIATHVVTNQSQRSENGDASGASMSNETRERRKRVAERTEAKRVTRAGYEAMMYMVCPRKGTVRRDGDNTQRRDSAC